MSYATTEDVQNRMQKTMSDGTIKVCNYLLEDAALFIDAFNKDAPEAAKKLVSCRMVIRALGDFENEGEIPIGASQGSMSALGYSQNWTIGGGGAVNEFYLTKAEKKLLRTGNSIGSYSPVQELVAEVES